MDEDDPKDQRKAPGAERPRSESGDRRQEKPRTTDHQPESDDGDGAYRYTDWASI